MNMEKNKQKLVSNAHSSSKTRPTFESLEKRVHKRASHVRGERTWDPCYAKNG